MGNRPEWTTLADAKLPTPEEIRKILDRAKQAARLGPMFERDYRWIAIAVNSGWRLSEVGHIEKGDILPSGRVLITRRKKRNLCPQPVEVMPAVHALLMEQAATVEAGPIFAGRAKPCVIHRSETIKEEGKMNVVRKWTEQVCVGGHASLRSIQRRWRLLLEELGVYMYGRGIHSLRHHAATKMYRETRDIRKVQVFLGHSSSKVTEVYAHVCDLADHLNSTVPLL